MLAGEKQKMSLDDRLHFMWEVDQLKLNFLLLIFSSCFSGMVQGTLTGSGQKPSVHRLL